MKKYLIIYKYTGNLGICTSQVQCDTADEVKANVKKHLEDMSSPWLAHYAVLELKGEADVKIKGEADVKIKADAEGE